MFIDLSVPLTATTPVYPGDPPLIITRTASVEEDGCELHSLSLGTHVGTHIDAPAHMLEAGASLGSIPLEALIGEAICIEAPDGNISVTELEAAQINEGARVIFNTGTHRQLTDPSYFTDYPVLSDEVVAYLVARKVQLVGLDTCSCDNQEGFPIHKKLLGAGIVIIENLTNLDQLAGASFRLYALPLKVDLDGAPTRVIAEVSS